MYDFPYLQINWNRKVPLSWETRSKVLRLKTLLWPRKWSDNLSIKKRLDVTFKYIVDLIRAIWTIITIKCEYTNRNV